MHSSPNYCFSTSHEKRCGLEGRRISQVLFLLALVSLNRACRNLVPAFPQRSPPWLLTKAACGDLRSAPDCRPRRACLHLSYSCASPLGPALLVTQDPLRTFYTTDRRSSNEWDPRMGRRREPETAQTSLRDVPMR